MNAITALASSTIFTTYSIYYIAQLGLNPLQLVLVGTVLELTVLLFEGLTGVVADTYSRKWSVIIGMWIMGGAFAFEGCVVWFVAGGSALPAFGWLLISQMLYGIGWTFISGANTAWLVDETGEEAAGSVMMRSQRFSLLASLLGIGLSVGLSQLAPNLPFLAGGAMYLLLGLLLIRRMDETGFARPEHEADKRPNPLREMAGTWMRGASFVRRSPLLLGLIVVTLLSGAASEGYDRLWPTLLLSGEGLPDAGLSTAAWFGVIGASITLLGLVGVRLAERRLDLGSRRAVTTALLLLTALRAAAIAGFALAPDFGRALCALLLTGTASAVFAPVYSAWLNHNLEKRSRATVLSMVSQSDALGQTAGGPFVGWIGSRFSIRAALLASGVLLLPLLGVFARMRGSAPTAAAEHEEQPPDNH
ncbi:MFS transporter [Saccharibacillus sp. CPCC 101409]|uniref:MFS transporter n=1 Tax=Saccharibacillus sp. CPCC 101409 TaxID=3058041 RepID=UPI002671E418|nr:MFS transporter [Saccharibacillus sp. CPCC 101409]MDO3409303.1 MFS transporter [Saccharibacillus sp. CPCC 101409]